MPSRHLRLFWGLFFVTLFGRDAAAQTFVYDVVYRPPGTRYFVLESPHFDVLYEDGALDEARETARRLERALPAVDSLVGARHTLHMPVVLNRFNDRANGFVSPLPFRQEIEAVSIKGNRLSPRFRSWIETVAPHELVHAVHADYRNGFGVVGLTRWFAPDLARSLNLTIPAGIAEGAAVLFESSLEPGAGRLNHSLFTMEFRAAMLSHRPWSLTQMLERPDHTRPFDRFYNGGGHLFQWLREHGPQDFFRRATNFHNRFPFLGYGVDLWYGLKQRPGKVWRAFRDDVRARERRRIEALGTLTEPTLVEGARGLVHRRPRWLDAHTLAAFVHGYNVTPGLYRLDAETGARALLSAEKLTEDQYFSLTPDTSAILFARYVEDPFVARKQIAELFRLDLATGRVERLTKNARALAPAPAPDGGVWALRNEGQYNRWVRLRSDGALEPLTPKARSRFASLEPSPDGTTVAVVLNVRGRQGLFRATLDGGAPVLRPWVGFEDGSVFDASWSRDGRYVLFTADPGGIANVYALDVREDRVLRLTNVPFGALEPALSPDGKTLAFVNYAHERYDLVRIPFDPEAARVVPRERTRAFEAIPWETWLRAAPPPTMPAAEARPYRTLRYLRPRMLYPTFRYEDRTRGPNDTKLGLGIGLGVQGADPLQRWAFSAEGFRQKGRLWGEGIVRTSLSVLRPSLRLFRTPTTVLARLVDRQGNTVETVRVGREERGVEAGVYVPVTLGSNVHRTSAAVAVRGSYRQERLFDRDGKALTPFTGRYTLSPRAALGYRLQANPRDLVPNTGLVVSAASEIDLSADRAAPRRALLGQANLYLPLLKSHNVGLRLNAGLLTQNQGSIYNLDRFMPRGHEDVFLGAGTFARYGFEITRPLWFIDNGFFLLPVYFRALFAFGFAETLHPVERFSDRVSSAGVGLGLRIRFFYLFNLELRAAASYRIEAGTWDVVYR